MCDKSVCHTDRQIANESLLHYNEWWYQSDLDSSDVSSTWCLPCVLNTESKYIIHRIWFTIYMDSSHMIHHIWFMILNEKKQSISLNLVDWTDQFEIKPVLKQARDKQSWRQSSLELTSKLCSQTAFELFETILELFRISLELRSNCIRFCLNILLFKRIQKVVKRTERWKISLSLSESQYDHTPEWFGDKLYWVIRTYF